MNGLQRLTTALRQPRPILAALALGAFAQLAQVISFREVMAVCHGTELLFGALLACGLLCTAAGSAAAVLIGRNDATGNAGFQRAVILPLVCVNGFVLVAQILVVRAAAGVAGDVAGQASPLAHAAAIVLLGVGPTAILTGFEFVLVLRTQPARDLGVLYRAESIGAALAGLAFTFLLVHLMSPVRAAIAGGALTAILTWRALRPWPARDASYFLLGATALLLILGAFPLEQWGHRMTWRSQEGAKLLECRDTPYGRACALARAGGAQVAIYHNGALTASVEPAASAPRPREVADLCATLHPSPRSALLIGGTLDAFPTELLRHGLDRVDALELDAALFDLAKRYGAPAESDARIQRIASDGRRFVKTSPADAYDLIIVSPGEPDNTLGNRYCTSEFFREAARRLSREGVFILFLPAYGSGAEYAGPGLARRDAAVCKAMHTAFRSVRAAPVDGHMFIGQNGDTPTGLDPGVLGRRLAQRPLASPVIRVTSGDRVEPAPVNPEEYFCCLGGGVLATQRTLDGAIRQPAVEELEWSIQEADIGANCDAHPTAILESLLVRAEVADGVASSLPERRPPEYPSDRGTWRVCAAGTPLAVALCVGVAAGVKGRRRNWNSPAARRWILGLAAFAAGLFGMTLEITLLTSYQAARGYVYSEIGGISGSFMAGLALGAWCSGRLTARARISVILLMTAMLAMISAVPAIARQWSDWSGPLTAAGCWLLVFAAGVLDGAIFPLLASRGQDAHDSRFGGWAYAADLAGAAMGGLLCGAVWLPLFGLAGAMGLAAAVLSVALISFVLAP